MEFNTDRQLKSYWDKFIGLTDANNEGPGCDLRKHRFSIKDFGWVSGEIKCKLIGSR